MKAVATDPAERRTLGARSLGPLAGASAAVAARWLSRRRLTGEGQLVASLIALSIAAFAFAARLRLINGDPSGDEPAYLVISQALSLYHSLDVMQVYNHQDYLAFYHGYLEPHVVPGANGSLRPLHQIGGPLLWFPFYAVAGRAGATVFIAVISVLTILNIYRFLRERGITAPYAFVVSAAFAIGSPVYVYASMTFVEPIGALFTLYAMRVILTRRPHPVRLTLAAAGAAYLPWVHMRFAPVALCLGVLLLWRVWSDYQRTRVWPYVQVVAPLVASVVIVEVFTIAFYDTVNPMAPQAIFGVTVLDNPLFAGFMGTVFDRNYGVIPNFPIFFLVLPGMLLSLGKSYRITNLVMLVIVMPYTVMTVTSTAWWGSYNPPARYPEVLLVLFAFYIALVLQRIDRWSVNAFAVLLAVGAYALHLTTDLFPQERFAGWDLRPDGMARLGEMIDFNFYTYAPSAFLPFQTKRFVAWALLAVVIGVLLWWAGRRRDMPSPLAGTAEAPVTGDSGAAPDAPDEPGRHRVSRMAPWARRGTALLVLAGLASASVTTLVAIGSERVALKGSDIVGVWYSEEGSRIAFAEDGTFTASRLRNDVITYAPLSYPAEHSADPRRSASGRWSILSAPAEVELHFVILDYKRVDFVRVMEAHDWARSLMLTILIPFPDTNLWYAFLKGHPPII